MNIQQINCDDQGRVFSGSTSCADVDLGVYLKSGVWEKGFKIPRTATKAEFATAYLTALRKNQLFSFNTWDAKNEHETNQVGTTNSGKEYLTRLGLPKFVIEAKINIGQAREISKINSNTTKWQIVHFFEKAIVLATDFNGDFKGFDLSILHAENTALRLGDENLKKTITGQLNSNKEYNERMTVIMIDDNLEPLLEVNGIVPIDVDVVITNATTLSVTLTDSATKNPIENVTDDTMYQLLGIQATPTTVTAVVANGNGNYTLTLGDALITNDTAGIKIAVVGEQCITIDGTYYGGSSELKVKS
jgi:hypothetical protein